MKSRRVIHGPRAAADYERIFNWLVDTASPLAALNTVTRLEERASQLNLASERGMRRDDLAPGLRIIALGDRAICAVRISDHEVMVARIFYGGEDWEAALRRGGID